MIGPCPTSISINLAGTCFRLALPVSEATEAVQQVGEDIDKSAATGLK